MNHWVDNADSYICPVCGFETDNPNRYKSSRCPKCKFQDIKDRELIYTRDEAARIVELFEEVLERYSIVVPSPEDDEREEDNAATLYGSVYYELLDGVEGILIDNLNQASESNVECYRFSGNV